MTPFNRLRVHVRYSRGIIRQYTGLRTKNRRHFRAAVQHYTVALGLNALHFDSRRCRGLLRWRELNDPHGAIEDFSLLLQQKPEFYDALFFRGMAYLQISLFQAAAHDLRTYLRLAPQERWSHSAQLQLDTLTIILENLPDLLSSDAPLLLGPGDDVSP